ncbi:MAG: SDR family oxidoreductase [Acidimicrobiia bacterium]
MSDAGDPTLVPLAEHLAGRRVLVSGGGSGIGAACATRLARDGAPVTICGRTRDRLVEAVERIVAEVPGADVDWQVADLTVEADVVTLVERAAGASGALGGVVANAGGGAGFRPHHLQDVERFRSVLDRNLTTALSLLKHTVGPLARGGGGSFVAMSSIAAVQAHPYFGAYAVAKAGLEQMVRDAAVEYGPYGVRCNAVRPGFIATEVMEAFDRDGPVYASYLENTPMGGVGRPEDVAALVRFLVGPESRWITGQAIGVDGGHALRAGPDVASLVVRAAGPDALDPR